MLSNSGPLGSEQARPCQLQCVALAASLPFTLEFTEQVMTSLRLSNMLSVRCVCMHHNGGVVFWQCSVNFGIIISVFAR